jgi:hypothetical protein
MHVGTTRKPKSYNVDGHRQSIPTQQTQHCQSQCNLLKQFYLTQQHKYHSNTIEKNFHQPQSKNTRYVHEPLNLPLIQINLHECNLDKDIKTT